MFMRSILPVIIFVVLFWVIPGLVRILSDEEFGEKDVVAVKEG